MSSTHSSSNVVWHHATVTRERRQGQNNHKSVILWFTGLSGAGKSSLAHAVEERLHEMNCRTYVLDGDNVRHGLCGDLGFSDADRSENIRRIAEVAKLFLEAGVISLTAFISPFREEREAARKLVPHGRARAGEIKDFTGISSPYEAPLRPELTVDTGNSSIEDCVGSVIELLRSRGIVG